MRIHGRRVPTIAASVLLASALAVGAGTADAQAPAAGTRLEGLRAATGGSLQVERHAETGRVRFLGTDPDQPLDLSDAELVDRYGALFGIRGDSRLVEERSDAGLGGSEAARYQQEVDGIPVVAGEIVVQTDDDGRVQSASGEASAIGSVDTSPEVSAEDASAIAVDATAAAHGIEGDGLSAAAPEPWVFDPALLDGPEFGPARLVWRTEVTDALPSIRELVLVDATTGGIALAFDQIAEGLDRDVCDDANVRDTDNEPECVAPFDREEGDPATGNPDIDLAYDYAGDTYDFFFDRFGRDSIDDNGLTLLNTVRYCPSDLGETCPYDNAFWNGFQMTYGEGYATADDVVGHELTHGVTENTNNLFYYYQSGAINESLSDVFGELMDLTNGAGDDSAGVRWDLGEDLPIGAIRDMEDPTTHGDPDRMTSASYTGTTADSGGVHTNSGVNNKTLFLITDGATFNGQTVTGVGTTKAADIYYEVATTMLTSGSDYADLGTGLVQSCENLIGVDGITAPDCVEVAEAVLATEMATSPPSSPAPEAPVCAVGETPTNLFFDDMEDTASGNWFVQGGGGNAWGYTPGYAHSGLSSLYAPNSTAAVDTSVFHPVDQVLPAGAHLWFAHAFDTDAPASPPNANDGGVIEYSTNGGGVWNDAGTLISENGYTRTVNAPSSALNGRQAFAAVSNGYRSTRLDLSSLAGQSVRFRWRFVSESGTGDLGWLLDDVRLYTCVAPVPGLSITKAADQSSVVAGQAIDYHVTVTNTGAVDLTDVAVTDADAPDCDTNIGDLDAGAAAVVIDCSYTTSAADIGTYSNTASADSTEIEPVASNQVNVTVTTATRCQGRTVTVDLAHGGMPTAGADVILGTAGGDVINALGGNDRICSLGGGDTVNGGNGADNVLAGNGNDTASGGNGNDTLDGGNGNDTLRGGTGHDTLFGRRGADRLEGGANRDTCNGGPQPDSASSCEVRS